MTTFVSMIEETLERHLDRTIVPFHGMRTVERALYLEKLKRLAETYPDGFRYVPVLSDEETEGYEKEFITSLEGNGIRVNVCCRSGEVFTAPGALLRYTDLQFGCIHSCKSYPISDIEIEF